MGKRSAAEKEIVQTEILSGWKDIARYLRKGVRTVQRYEIELGLPIRRPSGKSAGAVLATKAELDAWVAASPIRNAFQLQKRLINVSGEIAFNDFQKSIDEMRRLRSETQSLRKTVSESLRLLQTNLRSSLTETTGVFPTRSQKVH
jgi:hypothetical protein